MGEGREFIRYPINIKQILYKAIDLIKMRPRMFIGKPAPPEMLVDREEIIDKLVKDISNLKINPVYALLGYRRIGKTSILLKVKVELERKGLIVVYYDVKERLTDPESFLIDLQGEIFNAYRRHISLIRRAALKASELKKVILQKISDIVSSIDEVGVEISPDGTIIPKMRFGGRGRSDYAKLFRSVFKTADVIAERSNRRVVLILDEFQDITKLNQYKGLKNVLDLYRGVLQARGNISHIISGSRVHMLRNVLEKHESPLFQHFVSEFIGGLEEDDAMRLFSIIVEGRDLGLDKKSINRAAREAVNLVGGHPYYIMMLAEAWGGRTRLEGVFDRLISAPAGPIYLYTNYVLAEDLGEAKGGPLLKKIIRIMALEGKPMEASEIARRVGRSQNYLEFYLQELMKYDAIRKVGRGVYELVDKVIESCIAKSYR